MTDVEQQSDIFTIAALKLFAVARHLGEDHAVTCAYADAAAQETPEALNAADETLAEHSDDLDDDTVAALNAEMDATANGDGRRQALYAQARIGDTPLADAAVDPASKLHIQQVMQRIAMRMTGTLPKGHPALKTLRKFAFTVSREREVRLYRELAVCSEDQVRVFTDALTAEVGTAENTTVH